LVTAFATSPIGLPFLVILLMLTAGRTALGPWLWDHLHLVYIGLSGYCFVALAGACCLLRQRPLTRPVEEWAWQDRRDLFRRLGLAAVPAPAADWRRLEFHRWLVANGGHPDDRAAARGDGADIVRIMVATATTGRTRGLARFLLGRRFGLPQVAK
jgi:hypothetical protein